ncbi:CHAT domain-containing protein [Actinoplanes sp. NPDC049668]|uniref:CHAT domain-containing protein n=1 Tax=unclassified Actinoplanes TaxID=2626549 RepID=UPI0033AF9936
MQATLTGGRVNEQAVSRVEFVVSAAARERMRWYLEDFLEYPVQPAPTIAAGVEKQLAELGEQLFSEVFDGRDGQRLWGRLQDRLAETRVEIASEVEDATALPWELLRDPATGTPLALEAASFVRVNQQPARPHGEPPGGDRLRVLLVICRPKGGMDVPFRSVASHLVRLSADARQVLQLDVLRPPTFANLDKVLSAAKQAGRPYHVVHFDGHGTYLTTDPASDHTAEDDDGGGAGNAGPGDGGFSPYRYQPNFVSPPRAGSHGYLLFEDPAVKGNEQLVDGPALGDLLNRTGVSVLVLNACRSAYAEAPTRPAVADDHADGTDPAGEAEAADVHARVRGYGSLALEVTDAGVPGVVAMRYSVYVVTAARFVADLYAALLDGQPLGAAVTAGRRQLAAQPNRAIAFDPRPLQDWSVPVVYESAPIALFSPAAHRRVTIRVGQPGQQPAAGEPAGVSGLPRRPDVGFFGRDETLLALDRAFDDARIVLLHAYAGAGKTTTAAEFARWYTETGGLTDPDLGAGPVIFSSLEHHTPLARLLNQIGEAFGPLLAGNNIAWAALEQADRRDVAVQVLRQVPVLWIWDNVEPVAGFPAGSPSDWTGAEQAELADFLRDLADTKARVLLTSRREEHDWLGQLPARVELPRMPMRERIQLTQALAHRHRHRITDVQDWRPLLRYTAGNPLTITVLVGQALRDGLTSKTQIDTFVAALRAGEAPLDDDAAQGRSKSLGASLSFGFEHAFTDTERAQIALLHLFQDTADVDALTAICNPGADAALPQPAGLTRETGIALLDRAADIGLLTPLGGGYYTIHPALPWYFTHLFTTHHGAPDTPTAQQAQRAYTGAIARLGDFYHNQYNAGRHQVIDALAIEEGNLLHARAVARQHHRWREVMGCMQGLRVLYEHFSRGMEWARLVDELIPDLVDPTTGGPLPGRDNQWSVFTEYRVGLADGARDWTTAERLQTARVAFNRDRAAGALTTPPDQLDEQQRDQIRRLATSLVGLAREVREQQRPDCIDYYREAAELCQRIGERRGEAVIAFNLGNAYLAIPALRDLGQAEHWYRRRLELTDDHDRLGQARVTSQLGEIAYQQFKDARDAGAPDQVLLDHLNVAVAYRLQALDLTPADHLNDRAIDHAALGTIYAAAGHIDTALSYYQKAIKYYEDTEDRHWAGRARHSVASAMAVAGRYDDALLYAHAALRDFEALDPAAAADIERAQQLIADLEPLRKQSRGGGPPGR